MCIARAMPTLPRVARSVPLWRQVKLGDQHAELQQHHMRFVGYGISERLRIPRDVVRSVRFHGPVIHRRRGPARRGRDRSGLNGPASVGLPGLRASPEDALRASCEHACVASARPRHRRGQALLGPDLCDRCRPRHPQDDSDAQTPGPPVVQLPGSSPGRSTARIVAARVRTVVR
jgi:hypothetical protein